MLLLVLLVSSADAKTWYYHDLDSSQIVLELCDSLVTVQFDSAYLDKRMPDLPSMVPGLQQDYTPSEQDLAYWQYGVDPAGVARTFVRVSECLNTGAIRRSESAATFPLTDSSRRPFLNYGGTVTDTNARLKRQGPSSAFWERL
jgi:hypothetical protein